MCNLTEELSPTVWEHLSVQGLSFKPSSPQCSHLDVNLFSSTNQDSEMLLDSSPWLLLMAGVLVLQMSSREPREVPPAVAMDSYTERLAVLVSVQNHVFGSWAKGISCVISLRAGLKHRLQSSGCSCKKTTSFHQRSCNRAVQIMLLNVFSSAASADPPGLHPKPPAGARPGHVCCAFHSQCKWCLCKCWVGWFGNHGPPSWKCAQGLAGGSLEVAGTGWRGVEINTSVTNLSLPWSLFPVPIPFFEWN